MPIIFFHENEIRIFKIFFNLVKAVQVLFIYLLLFSTVRFSWKYAVRRSMNLTPEAEIKWGKEIGLLRFYIITDNLYSSNKNLWLLWYNSFLSYFFAVIFAKIGMVQLSHWVKILSEGAFLFSCTSRDKIRVLVNWLFSDNVSDNECPFT